MTHPNPGRCEPEPSTNGVCSIAPEFIVIPVGDGDTLDVDACNPDLPQSGPVTVDWTLTSGEVGSPDADSDNCDNVGSYPYTAPDLPGYDHIKCVCHFSDGGEATGVATAYVF